MVICCIRQGRRSASVCSAADVSATDGQIISLGKVFGLRYVPIQIASVIPAIGNILPLLDVLFIFREDRRCLHDFIAGTKVVKAK